MSNKSFGLSPRIAKQTVIGLFLIAGLFWGYQKFKDYMVDPDSGVADSVGMIAAIEQKGNGQQAVVFSADGTKKPCPDYVDGTTDKDIAWRPDGNRLFLSSDREKGVFQIFRWNLANDKVQARTAGTLSKSHVAFGPPGFKDQKTALVTVGGFVQEFSPRDSTLRQVLPPVGNTPGTSEEGGGGIGSFDSLYRDIGSSFREARWSKDRKGVFAVLDGEVGESLIYQSLAVEKKADESEGLVKPQVLVTGNRIEFDVAEDGRIVYAVLDFRYLNPNQIPKEAIKNGVAVAPYMNGVFVADFFATKPSLVTLGLSANRENAISRPRFAPDGKSIICRVGKLSEALDFETIGVIRAPVEEGGLRNGTGVVRGEILDYDWSPDGSKIVFCERVGGKRRLFVTNSDGSERKDLSSPDVDTFEPRFSPQVKP
ncbi:MAG: PD40 domain-containing protein [Armatimonadetes bacterium]|nr:PD40 domain-containing protein [Armatimonadota bacterium]